MSNSSREFQSALQAKLDEVTRGIAHPAPSAFDIEAYIFMLTDEEFNDLIRRTRPRKDETGEQP